MDDRIVGVATRKKPVYRGDFSMSRIRLFAILALNAFASNSLASAAEVVILVTPESGLRAESLSLDVKGAKDLRMGPVLYQLGREPASIQVGRSADDVQGGGIFIVEPLQRKMRQRTRKYAISHGQPIDVPHGTVTQYTYCYYIDFLAEQRYALKYRPENRGPAVTVCGGSVPFYGNNLKAHGTDLDDHPFRDKTIPQPKRGTPPILYEEPVADLVRDYSEAMIRLGLLNEAVYYDLFDRLVIRKASQMSVSGGEVLIRVRMRNPFPWTVRGTAVLAIDFHRENSMRPFPHPDDIRRFVGGDILAVGRDKGPLFPRYESLSRGETSELVGDWLLRSWGPGKHPMLLDEKLGKSLAAGEGQAFELEPGRQKNVTFRCRWLERAAGAPGSAGPRIPFPRTQEVFNRYPVLFRSLEFIP